MRRLRGSRAVPPAPVAQPDPPTPDTQALFRDAAEAGASGDHRTSQALYEDLWQATGSDYFRVRALEARRLHGCSDAALAGLEQVSIDEIIESLSMEHCGPLIARRIALTMQGVDALPPVLANRRDVLDGIGKHWERTGEVAATGTRERDLVTLAKVGLDVTTGHVRHESRPLELTSPRIIWTDAPLPGATTVELPRLAGGWCEITDAYAACDSNAFVSSDRVHVDEYRDEFPAMVDPATDPLVVGSRSGEVLTFGIDGLAQRASTRGLSGFWLAGRFSNEWGHWISCHLTRIPYLREHPEWGRLPLIVRAGLPRVLLEFLDLLAPGIPRVELDPGEIVHVERVVVSPGRINSPPQLREAPTWPPRHGFAEPEQLAALCDDLRPLGGRSSLAGLPQRVYVPRVGFARRDFAARATLHPLLEGLGFTAVGPQHLTAADQVATWLAARTMVGERASWVFLSALNPETDVVVLTSNRIERWWAQAAGSGSARQRPLECVVGQTLDDDPENDHESRGHGPWTLSPQGFTALSDRLTEHEPAAMERGAP